jgi:transcription elongation factor GreB
MAGLDSGVGASHGSGFAVPVAHNGEDRAITAPDATRMSKAFVKDDAGDGDDDVALPEQPAGVRNYITAAGYGRLREELAHLVKVERPEVVRVVSWAASNGDRSENGDYIYGKKRLREIDRRIRFLTKRLDIAEVVDSTARPATDQVFFGATVRYQSSGQQNEVTIVGVDEVDPARGRVSWISPIARALLKAREGDVVQLKTPAGVETLEIVAVGYAAS